MSTETLHQILAVIPVCYNEFTMGLGYGWTAPTLTKLRSSQEYTVEDLSWIGSTHEFGRIIGPFLAALLLDRVGRKKILILCAIIFLLSWLGIMLEKSVLCICLSRLLFGIGNGFNDVTSSIYLGENYPPKVRGIFCSFVIICFCGAELIQFIVVSWLTYETTATITTAIAFLGVFSTYWLVETPQFLLLRKDIDGAEKNLQWLRGTAGTSETSAEFDKIKQNVEEERMKKTSYKELLTARANYKSLIITFMLNVFTMGTGYAAVLSYMTMVFSSTGTFTEYQFTVFYGIVQLIFCTSVSLYIERFDRRTLILASYSSIAITHAITATLLYTHENVSPIAYFPWLVFASISAYGAIYAPLFTTVHMIRGELFPQSIKAIGGFVAITMHSTMAFLTSRAFLPVATNYGSYANFLIYAAISLTAFVYSYLQLPETRGKMLVDIQKHLES